MKNPERLIIVFIILSGLMLGSCSPSAHAARTADRRLEVLNTMEEELARSKEKLKLEDYSAPYYLAYRVKVRETSVLEVRYESVYRASTTRDADVYVEVRIGDYSFDNTGDEDSFLPFALPGTEGLPLSHHSPIDNNLKALRNTLWLLSDMKYKEALNQFEQKKAKSVYQKPDDSTPSFSREEPTRYVGEALNLTIDEALWKKRLIALSGLFRNHPSITQHILRFQADRVLRHFVNSEGSRIIDERVLLMLTVDAETRAGDDMVLTYSEAFYAPGEGKMPPMSEIRAGIQKMIDQLVALRDAPVMDPYSGPAILMPQATAVLFHEAVGHRLEGERQNSEEEGRTYKGKVGQKILPDFLNLTDDPTLAVFEGVHLNGHYLFDSEGVPAGRTVLVENGKLKTFLMSRSPVEGFSLSNGHGRASGNRKPMARMGNTILVSKKQVPFDELKATLIKMVKEQEKPYGIIVDDIEGGSTNTSSYGYQAFKGVPSVVRRVYPDGREELVRGVELVGTPIASINKIVLAGDKSDVFNGFCGAESGYVPVSAIAPAVLLKELEVQRKKEGKSRPPILKSPYNGEKQ